ncbi:MAG TPA: hypothetical protein VEI25_09530 [Paraburkholderia sp.]|nr:hypothetical protein [Paraburkholderia sp.]
MRDTVRCVAELCIDRDATAGQGLHWNHIPYGAAMQVLTGCLHLRSARSNAA